MTSVLLTIHLIVTIALVVSVLLQRSEGGALGIGDGPGGLMTGRAAATLLSRTTAVLGALFFILAIALTVVPNLHRGKIDSEIIGAANAEASQAVKQAADQKTAPAASQPAQSTDQSANEPAQAVQDKASSDAAPANGKADDSQPKDVPQPH